MAKTEAQKPKLEVTITDYDLERALYGSVQDYVNAQMEKRFEKLVTETIAKALDARLKTLAAKVLDEKVTKVVTEGWQTYSPYGDRTGAVTVEQKIREYLFPKDRYNDPIYDIFKKCINAALEKDLGGALAEATAKLRAQLDETIAGKLRESIASAFKGA